MYGLTGNEDETMRLRDLITRALSESTNDLEFEASYRRAVGEDGGIDDLFSWPNLTWFLYQYRLTDAEVLTPRVLAEHYLKDIESRYHLEVAA